MSAVRRHRDRERLETNRERVARNLSGAAKPSTPAVREKAGFIPRGFCVQWNKVVRTNMRFLPKETVPPSLKGTVVVDVPHQEPIRQRVKARRNVFSGREDGVRGVRSVRSSMVGHQEGRDRPRLR